MDLGGCRLWGVLVSPNFCWKGSGGFTAYTVPDKQTMGAAAISLRDRVTALLQALVLTTLLLVGVTLLLDTVAASVQRWGEASVPYLFGSCFLLALLPMFLWNAALIYHIWTRGSSISLLLPPLHGLIYVLLAGCCFGGYLLLTDNSWATLSTLESLAAGGILGLGLVELVMIVAAATAFFLPRSTANYHLV
jgi:hypothetical protein